MGLIVSILKLRRNHTSRHNFLMRDLSSGGCRGWEYRESCRGEASQTDFCISSQNVKQEGKVEDRAL